MKGHQIGQKHNSMNWNSHKETKRAQSLKDQPEIPLSKIKSEQRVPLSGVLMKTQSSSISADESWPHLI